VLLDGFTKKAEKTSQGELERALRYKEDYERKIFWRVELIIHPLTFWLKLPDALGETYQSNFDCFLY
jgi:hypothetical protein